MRYALMHRGIRISIPDGGVVLGRGLDCDLVVDGDEVSRRHARFAPTAEGLDVEDLGSVNGVFVNGERIEERRALQRGDVVTVAAHELRVSADYGDDFKHDTVPTLAELVPIIDDDLEDITVVAGPLGMRFQSALGMLEAGMVNRVEREFIADLRKLVTEAKSKQPPMAIDVQLALRFVLKLAHATRRASWLQQALEIVETTRVPLTSDLVEELDAAVQAIGDPVLGETVAESLRVISQTKPPPKGD